MARTEGFLKHGVKKFLGIDEVTLESMNSFRASLGRKVGDEAFQQEYFSHLLPTLAILNQILPLVATGVTESYRRGGTIEPPGGYKNNALSIDALATLVSISAGIVAEQLLHSPLEGLGIFVGAKELTNVVSMRAGRRMLRNAPLVPPKNAPLQ